MITSRGPIVATIDSPSQIERLVGGTGPCTCKQLINGFHLEFTWNCVEHVAVPAGSSIGAHTHDRTEEIYVLLSGRGCMQIDGESVDVTAGDVVTTQIGTRHSIAGIEPSGVTFLVVEAFPSERHHGDGRSRVLTRTTADADGSAYDLAAALTGAWHALDVVDLAHAAVRTFPSDDGTERVVFIAAGAVSADVDVAPLLQAGQCMFVPSGMALTVRTASATPARLIIVALRER
jgi:mannose-6-phosphate isomerase-like protein (cupin superfamily)